MRGREGGRRGRVRGSEGAGRRRGRVRQEEGEEGKREEGGRERRGKVGGYVSHEGGR